MIYLYNGILLCNIKLTHTHNMDKPQKYYFEQKKSDTKEYILYDSNYEVTNLQNKYIVTEIRILVISGSRASTRKGHRGNFTE